MQSLFGPTQTEVRFAETRKRPDVGTIILVRAISIVIMYGILHMAHC